MNKEEIKYQIEVEKMKIKFYKELLKLLFSTPKQETETNK